jgi:hypothetical protein
VGLFTEGQRVAHSRGFALHYLFDCHSSYLLRSVPRWKIPDLFMLDPETWPAQGYVRRFFSARVDVTSAKAEAFHTLRDHYDVIAELDGWDAVEERGTTVRAFMEAVMHVMQLHFFGMPMEKVSCVETCRIKT